jgi:hypothetical protein
MKLKLAIASVVLSLTWPLSSSGQSAPVAAAQATEEPRPIFQTIDHRKSNLVRADMGADWRSYKRIRFEPVAYEPSGCGHRLNPRQASKISSTFAAALESTRNKFDSNEGATILVRPVITNVKRTNTLVNLISFAAIQMPASYGGASVRYELLDESNGKQIGEITSSRNARPWNVYPWNFFQNFEALGQSSVILKSEARSLRRDLDRLSKPQANQTPALAAGAE